MTTEKVAERGASCAPICDVDRTVAMDLSVIIVNWNSQAYLRKCLFSILSQTRDIRFEIIVIDAGSFDGCETMLREEFPEVRFIQSQNNLGFGQSNNLAFHSSTGSCVLLLNPDTELEGPAISVLYRALHQLDKPGVLGCKLLNSDRTVQLSCIKAFPNLANELADAEALRRIFPRARLWGMRPLFENSEQPSEVDAVSGACMMMRREVFESCGGFDPRYFTYSEDVDLCLKAHRAGLKNYYVPTAVIVHHGGRSTAAADASSFSSVMMLESRWRYFRVRKSKIYGSIYRLAVSLISIIRIGVILVACLVKKLGHQSVADWQKSLGKWVARLRWTLGLEGWVKDYPLKR